MKPFRQEQSSANEYMQPVSAKYVANKYQDMRTASRRLPCEDVVKTSHDNCLRGNCHGALGAFSVLRQVLFNLHERCIAFEKAFRLSTLGEMD